MEFKYVSIYVLFMLHMLLALDLRIFIEACLVLSYTFCYEIFLLPILMLYTTRIPLDAWLNLRAIYSQFLSNHDWGVFMRL